MMTVLTGLLLASLVGVPADVKGTWSGRVFGTAPDGTTSEDTALLLLDQKDGTVTGTIGGNENDQHAITKGTIDGSKVTIVAENRNNGREIRLEMTLEGEAMKGTILLGERRGQIEVKRRKE